MQAVTTIALDIAKSVFQVNGVDAAGQVVVRRQLKRRSGGIAAGRSRTGPLRFLRKSDPPHTRGSWSGALLAGGRCPDNTGSMHHGKTYRIPPFHLRR
jgi:hypothetical protein